MLAPTCAHELGSSIDEACKPLIEFLGKNSEEIDFTTEAVSFLKACSTETKADLLNQAQKELTTGKVNLLISLQLFDAFEAVKTKLSS